MEVCSLAEIMDAIKGVSAHKINKALGRKGRVWQPESFDHVLRSSENLDAKIEYVLQNPVRQGLSRDWNTYPWVWRKPFVNPFGPLSLHKEKRSCAPRTAEGGCPHMNPSAVLS
jgi:hypothetical protein